MVHLLRDAGFTEVADRCWAARHAWYDVNVGVVGGARGLVVVDTHASERAARAVIEQVRALGAGEVVAVVNTHEHGDHVLGNAAFAAAYPGAALVAHEEAAARTPAAADRMRAEYDAAMDDPRREEVLGTTVRPATETFSSVRVLDLGDRLVELVHPGRGHTGGDVVVRVADADALFAGDLVEEAAPADGSSRAGVPAYGDDCYPLDWPASLDLVVGLLTEASVVVPGHGDPVGRDFVTEQRAAIGVVAETIRDLATRGVPVEEALRAAWPYPAELLRHAVTRGYAQLPRSRSLPLL